MSRCSRAMWLAGLLAAAALALAGVPGAARDERDSFVPVRIERDGTLAQAARNRAVQALSGQVADPRHVVVLIHGWDTPFYASEEQYAEVAPLVRKEFGRHGEPVGVLGVQWHSDAGPRRKWVPQAFAHHLLRLVGFRKAVRDPYSSRVPLARATGRLGLRQLLFAVKERFPSARVHIFAHSMGAEAVVHALDPGFTPGEAATYREGDPLALELVALAGADLDFDAEARAPEGSKDRGVLPKILWITLPKIGERQDRVLKLRKQARGKAALGNSVPQLRGEQIEAMFSQRCLMLDTIDIPTDHALVKYYGQGRLARLADAAVTLASPEKSPSAMLKQLDTLLAAPDDVKAIAPHLFGGETSPKVYALWRLERILCGGPGHLESGYATQVLDRTLKDPLWLDEERRRTDCRTVRDGLWPPADVVARARAVAEQKRAPKREGNAAFFTSPPPAALGP